MDELNAKQAQELREEIDRLWSALGHSDNARRAREEASQWQRRTDDLRNELSAFLVQTHVETANYFRVVTAVAYAGYFATWTLVNKDLPLSARFTIALLGIVSLGVYGVWEIFMMQYRQRSLGKIGALLRDAIAPDIFEERRLLIQRDEANFLSMMTPIWKLVMIVSIGSIVFGGAMMIFYFLRGISAA